MRKYGRLFDHSLSLLDTPNRVVSIAVAVMELSGLAEPLPNRLYAYSSGVTTDLAE